MDTRKTFFISVKRKNNLIISHTISFKKPITNDKENESVKVENLSSSIALPNNFDEILNFFERNMAIYMDFVPVTLSLMPALSQQLGTSRLDKFLNKKAAHSKKLSGDTWDVFELDVSSYPEYQMCRDQMANAEVQFGIFHNYDNRSRECL